MSALLLILFGALFAQSEAGWTSGSSVVDRFGRLNLHPNLKCWLHEDNLVSLSGATVSSWADKSNSGLAGCSFAPAGNSIALKKNRLNGHNIAAFDEKLAGSYLTNTNSLFTTVVGNTVEIRPFTAFFVVRFTDQTLVAANPTLFSIVGSTNKLELQLTNTNNLAFSLKFSGSTQASTRRFFPNEWHIICVHQRESETDVYVDGTSVENLKVTVISADTELNLGTVAAGGIQIGTGSAGSPLFTGELAEVLIYNDQLTVFEIDRVGFYLATRFNLLWQWYSPSAAHIGGGVQSFPITIQPQAKPVSGQPITITGDRLMPFDHNTVTPDLNSVIVTAGVRIPLCSPETENLMFSGAVSCAQPAKTVFGAARIEKECTSLVISNSGPAVSSEPYSGTKTSLICNFPEGIGQQLDLVIKWHGIPYVISGISFEPPVVTNVIPVSSDYRGGVPITIFGKYFGPGNYWVTTSDAGRTAVEFVGENSAVEQCVNVKLVDQSSLVCTIPPLRPTRYSFSSDIKAARQADFFIQIRVGANRYRSRTKFSYVNVPAAYSCSNDYVTSDVSSLMQCQRCCSQYCITVDSVLDPTINCDSFCGTYCRLQSTSSSFTCDLSSPSANPNPICFETAYIDGFTPFISLNVTATQSTTASVTSGVLSVSPSRPALGAVTLTFTGMALTLGDKVKIIPTILSCGGSDDKTGAVAGGEGRVFDSVDGVGITATAAFTFPVAFLGQVCYKPSTGREYTEARGAFVSIPTADTSVLLAFFGGGAIPPSGSVSLTVVGTNLGGSSSSRGRVGGTPCETSIWSSDCNMLCRTPSGTTGSLRSVVVTASPLIKKGTLQNAIRFASLSISSIVSTNGPPTGARSITVLGTNLRGNYSPRVRTDSSATAATTWVSLSCVSTKFGGAIARSTVNIRVSAALNIQNARNEVFTVGRVALSNLVRSNGPKTGGTSLTILTTSSPGLTSSVCLHSTAQEATRWVSVTAVRARRPRSISEPASYVSISVPLFLVSTVTLAWTLDYSGVDLNGAIGYPNIPRTSSVSITMFANGLGMRRTFSVRTRLGKTPSMISVWTSDSALSAKSPKSDSTESILSNNFVVATGAGPANRASTLTTLMSWDSPSSSSVIRTNFPNTSSLSITVLGRSSVSTLSGRRRIFGTASMAFAWFSSSAVSAKVSAGAPSQRVAFALTSAANEKLTVTQQLSYDTAALLNNGVINSPHTGSSSITLPSRSLGTRSFTSSLRVPSSAALVTVWVSDSSAICKAPSLVAKLPISRSVCVSIFALSPVSTLTLALSFNHPDPSSILPGSRLSTTGSVSVTIFGRGVGSISGSGSVAIGRSGAESTSNFWISHSQIFTKVPSGLKEQTLLFITQNRAHRAPGTLTLSISYFLAGLSSAVRFNTASTGSHTVTVLGRTLTGGRSAGSLKVRFARTATAASVWVSDSVVVAKAVVHLVLPSSQNVVVSGELARSSVMTLVSMDSIAISSIVSRNHPRTGSVTLTVLGSNGPINSRSYCVRIRLTAATATVWRSASSLCAKVSDYSASIASSSLVVTVAQDLLIRRDSMMGTFTRAVSVNMPLIFSTTQTNLPQSGAISATLYLSSEFGFGNSVITGRFGNTGVESSSWRSVTGLACRVQRMITSDRGVASTVSLALSTLTLATSFDKPYRIQIQSGNTASSGSQSVTLTGLRFGALRLSFGARPGATASSATSWTSESTVIVKPSAPSHGMAAAVAVTLLRGTGTSTLTITFNRQVVNSLTNYNKAATGSISVTYYGSNICFRGSSRIRVLTQEPATDWVSQSSIISKAGPATGAPFASTVVLTTQSNRLVSGIVRLTVTTLLSHDSPALTLSMISNAPSTGGTSVTLLGTNSGRIFAGTVRTRVAVTSCDSTTWITGTALTTKVPATSFLVSANSDFFKLAITFPQFPRISFTKAFSVDATVIPIIGSASTHRTNIPLTGSTSITFVGAIGLGQRQGAHTQAIRSFTACTATTWMSTSAIGTKLPTGVWAKPTVALTIRFFSGVAVSFNSLSNTVSYDHPEVLVRTLQANIVCTSGVAVTLSGSGYGPLSTTRRPGWFGTAAVATIWISESSFALRTPGTLSGTGPITLSVNDISAVAQARSTLTRSITVDTPFVSSGIFCNSPTTGSVSVSIYAAAHGPRLTFSPDFRFGRTGASVTNWISETSIFALSPPSLETPLASVALTEARLLQGKAMSTITNIWSFDVNVCVYNSRSTNTPVTGGWSVTVSGSRMSMRSGRMRAKGSASISTRVISDTSIRGKSSPAYPIASIPVMVTQRVRRTLTNAVSINTPAVRLITNLPFTGGFSVTVVGTNYAFRLDYTPNTRIGDTSADSTPWVTTSSLVVKSASGSPQIGLREVVTVFSLRGSISLALTFNVAIRLSAVTPSNVPPTGSASITLAGSASWMALSRRARIGGSGTDAFVRWLTNSALTLKSCSGMGFLLAVIVSQPSGAVQDGTLSLSFTFSAPGQCTSSMNLPKTGATSLTVLALQSGGERLGYTLQHRLGMTSAEGTTWLSHSNVIVKSVSTYSLGANVDRQISITVTTFLSSSAKLLSYNAPETIGPLPGPANIPQTGAISVTVLGSKFYHLTSAMRVAATSGEGTSFFSDTALTCKAGSNFPALMRAIEVTVFRLAGTITNALTYDLGTAFLSQLIKSNIPGGTGSVSVTVLGHLMRVSPTGRVRGTLSLATAWCSLSAVLTKAPAQILLSVAPGQPLAITSSPQPHLSFTSAFSFDPSVSPILVSVFKTNLVGTGSVSMTMIGTSYSALPSSRASILTTAGLSTRWQSCSSLAGKIPAAHYAFIPIVATVFSGAVRGTLTLAISFDRFVRIFVATNLAITGSQSVTVAGHAAMGRVSTGGTLTLTALGGSSSQAHLWTSVSAVSLKSPRGMNIRQSIVVTSGAAYPNIRTLTNIISYNLAIGIRVTENSNFPNTASASVTVRGSTMSVSTQARFGRTSGSAFGWVCDTSLTIKTVFSELFFAPMALSMNPFLRSITRTISSDLAAASSYVTTNIPLSGSVSITMLSGRCVMVQTCAIQIQNTAAQTSSWQSLTSVIIKSSQWMKNARIFLRLSATTSAPLVTTFNSLTYNSPEFSSTICVNGPPTGAISLTLLTTGELAPYPAVGGKDLTQSGRIGVTGAQRTRWASTSSFVLRTARGDGVAMSVILSIGSSIRTISAAFTHENKFVAVSAVSRTNAPSTGGLSLSLSASYFGLPINSPKMIIAYTAAECTSWMSFSSVRGRLSAGTYKMNLRNEIYISASPPLLQLVFTLTQIFTYDSAFISAAVATNAPPTGGISVTLLKLAAARTSQSEFARLQGSPAEASVWVSTSSVTARCIGGHSTPGASVQITIATKISPTWPFFPSAGKENLSFNSPTMSSISPCNAPSTGGISVTVYSRNFGVLDYTPAMRSGASIFNNMQHNTATSASTWTTDTNIATKISLWNNGITYYKNAVLVATVRRNKNSLANRFTYQI